VTSLALTRGRAATAAAVLAGGLVAAAAAVAVAAPSWTPVLGGALLLGAGFAVMAPCQLQMAATLSVVLQRRAATTPRQVRGSALRFAGGYLAFYVPVALVLGLAAHLLGPAAWALTVLGGLAAVVLGLAALGRLAPRWLQACRGPLYLLRSGRASFAHPGRAGIAFGQYCASCCGPYVYALVVFAGATHAAWTGAALVLAYAVAMAAPFVAPVLVAPARWQAFAAAAGDGKPALDRGAGIALVGIGALVVPVGVLAALAG